MSDIDKALKRNLRYASARFFLGELGTSEVLRTIETAMKAGLWRDEFLALFGCEPIFRTVQLPFAQCLDALGVTVTSFEEAILVIIDNYTRAIVEGGESRELDDLFARDLRSLDFDLSWDKRLLEGAGAEALWNLFDDYRGVQFEDDDPSSANKADETYRAYQRLIQEEAARWQSTHRI